MDSRRLWSYAMFRGHQAFLAFFRISSSIIHICTALIVTVLPVDYRNGTANYQIPTVHLPL